ncbi:MAG: hypothetical protein AAGD28_05695 [Bacteroidota bacterium]
MSDTSPGSIQRRDNIPWDFLSAFTGILGLILSFIPYLSLGGIIMGLLAIFLGIKAFRSKQKKFLAGLGMLAGSLSILSLILILLLLIFF